MCDGFNTLLLKALPVLIPKAIAWAEAQYATIAQVGLPLDARQLGMARSVGVLHPELIRIAGVPSLPLPEDPDLRQAALATGLLGSHMIGMTFGHGVYICRGRSSIALLSHEFRHVQQYELAGSIAGFLPEYLHQIVSVGYDNAPYELDARAHEQNHYQ